MQNASTFFFGRGQIKLQMGILNNTWEFDDSKYKFDNTITTNE